MRRRTRDGRSASDWPSRGLGWVLCRELLLPGKSDTGPMGGRRHCGWCGFRRGERQRRQWLVRLPIRSQCFCELGWRRAGEIPDFGLRPHKEAPGARGPGASVASKSFGLSIPLTCTCDVPRGERAGLASLVAPDRFAVSSRLMACSGTSPVPDPAARGANPSCRSRRTKGVCGAPSPAPSRADRTCLDRVSRRRRVLRAIPRSRARPVDGALHPSLIELGCSTRSGRPRRLPSPGGIGTRPSRCSVSSGQSPGASAKGPSQGQDGGAAG